MLVDGIPVAHTTGRDIEAIQDKLFRDYFHLPAPTVKRKKPRS